MANNEVVFELLKQTASHPYEYFVYETIGPDSDKLEELIAVLRAYQRINEGVPEEIVNIPNEEKIKVLKKALTAVL